jgi:hypothetical protein
LRFQVPVDPTWCASVSGSGRHLEDHDQQRHDDDDIQVGGRALLCALPDHIGCGSGGAGEPVRILRN